jgi:hypothetical protein
MVVVNLNGTKRILSIVYGNSLDVHASTYPLYAIFVLWASLV